jgi:hypothetical protein
MEPWPDQWAFLSSVARLTPEAAAALADSLRPVDAGPALTFADPARAGGPPPPELIRARLGARLSIERSGIPPAIVAALKHLGSIHNPAFYEKQRLRFSTWDTPRFIRCYEEDLEWIHLPRGLVERVIELMETLGSRLEITDARPEQPAAGLGFIGRLRSQQSDAVDAALPHDRGVIVAPPGAGKTMMACAVIAHHDRPTLDRGRRRRDDPERRAPGETRGALREVRAGGRRRVSPPSGPSRSRPACAMRHPDSGSASLPPPTVATASRASSPYSAVPRDSRSAPRTSPTRPRFGAS